MKWTIFALLIISVVLLSSCGPVVTPPPPAPEPSPGPPPLPSPSPQPLPPPSLVPPPTSQQPLNVTIDYIGIKSNHAPASNMVGNIYLLLVVTDGYQKAFKQFLPVDGTFSLNGYETLELDQLIFYTNSAGDWLKVSILAYQQNDPRWLTSILIPALAEIKKGLDWADYRSVDEILSTVDDHMDKSTIDFINGGDSLIGYYEDVWGTNQSLGIGQYDEVGSEDFRLWFSIWSEIRSPPPPQPTLLPDVTLNNVGMLSMVNTGQPRTDIITIKNEELHPVTVTLRGTSSKNGDFFSKDVEVPAEVNAWAVESYSVYQTPGPRTITYELYHRDRKLDSWSETLDVTRAPQVTLVEWRESAGSSMIETTMEGTPVTLYVEAAGYNSKDLAASIRRVEPLGGYSYETTVYIKIINGRGLGKWEARWQEVTYGNPRYVFNVKGLYSAELTVVRRYKPPPDVTIYNVAMVSRISVGQVRADTITLKSNESELIVVRLKGYSSTDGEFYNHAVSIPEEGYTSVEIQSSYETPGTRTITYKLYYEGVEFRSWSGLLEVFD